jgi:hypothetical protein
MSLVNETLEAIQINLDQASACDPISETDVAIPNICGALEGLNYLMTAGAIGTILRPLPSESEESDT